MLNIHVNLISETSLNGIAILLCDPIHPGKNPHEELRTANTPRQQPLKTSLHGSPGLGVEIESPLLTSTTDLCEPLTLPVVVVLGKLSRCHHVLTAVISCTPSSPVTQSVLPWKSSTVMMLNL